MGLMTLNLLQYHMRWIMGNNQEGKMENITETRVHVTVSPYGQFRADECYFLLIKPLYKTCIKYSQKECLRGLSVRFIFPGAEWRLLPSDTCGIGM